MENKRKKINLSIYMDLKGVLGHFFDHFPFQVRRNYVCNIFIKVITRKGAYTTCGSGMRFFQLSLLYTMLYVLSGGCSILAHFKHCSRSRRQSSHTHTNNFPPYLRSNKSDLIVCIR